MPPLSPDPAELSCGSMSACRKSWATVRPSRRSAGGAARAPRSMRASPATSPRSPSCAARCLRNSASRGSVARWPIADTAAMRTTLDSTASDARRKSGAVAMGFRTRPSVSTTRARASGSTMPSRAPSAPTTSCSAVADDHFSSVRCASIPAKPPATTIPSSGPMASARGRPEPRAHAACSRRKGRSSVSWPTSIRLASPSNTSASACVAAMAASSSSPRTACARTRIVRTPGSRPASKARSSASRIASTIAEALLTASSAVWTPKLSSSSARQSMAPACAIRACEMSTRPARTPSPPGDTAVSTDMVGGRHRIR